MGICRSVAEILENRMGFWFSRKHRLKLKMKRILD